MQRDANCSQVLPDFIGPWMAIASLICALEHRHRTGEGQYLDVSQREAIMLYLQPALIEYGVTGVSPERRGNGSPIDAPHGVYPGKGRERWIAIVVTSDIEWRALHELLPNAMRKRFPPMRQPRNGSPARKSWTPPSPPGPQATTRENSRPNSRHAVSAPISSVTGRTCSTTRNSRSESTTSPASTRSWGRR
ncbi:MAG: CoA transferase [Gammaproteobacteria bacterium]|nr:CoA transferase [Rhodospirillaceae bacterium]MDE0364858.1 CoA transferase [Gammaproteobacteria bacterium]